MDKAGYSKGKKNLRLVEEVVKRGKEVWLDQYPHVTNSTSMNTYNTVGPRRGIPALLKRLWDPEGTRGDYRYHQEFR